MKITLYNNTLDTKGKEIGIEQYFTLQKSDYMKEHTDYLRNENDKDKRKEYKKTKLPAVTIAGTFSQRNAKGLKEPSGLMVFDYDKEVSEEILNKLKKNEYVYSFFRSPSGFLKIIFKLPKVKSDEEYKKYYLAGMDYLCSLGLIVDTTQDICRLCFLSYDPNLYRNEESKVFTTQKKEQKEVAFTEEKPAKETQKTRSETEYVEVLKLISKGKTKQEIFEHMEAFSKWSSQGAAYQEHTYKKALKQSNGSERELLAQFNEALENNDEDTQELILRKIAIHAEKYTATKEINLINKIVNKIGEYRKEMYGSKAGGMTKSDIKKIFYKVRKEKKENDKRNEIRQNNNENIITAFSQNYDYITLAKQFVEHNPLFYDKSKIWWMWNKLANKYEIVDETDILNLIRKGTTILGITNSKVKSEILESFRLICREKIPKEAPKEWIQFDEKIYDLKKDKEFDASPHYFLTNPIPWQLGDSDETPFIDSLVKSWMTEKKDQDSLYELMSYLMLRDYPIQRIMILLGAGGNGKGSYLRLIKKFIGLNNITSTELDMITNPNQRFEKVKLYKKLLCQMGETNVGMLKYTSVLKQLTGGDIISGEYKNKNSFEFENYAKIVVATNNLPITIDKTIGFYRRINILHFKNSYDDGKEITDEIPEYEFNNLARKLITHLKTLLKNGRFSNDTKNDEREKKYEELSNPISALISKSFEKNINGYVFKSEFNELVEKYLKNTKQRILTNQEINTGLKAIGLEIGQKKIDGENHKIVRGISKKEFIDEKDEKGNRSNQKNHVSHLISYIENQVEKSVTSVTSVTFLKNNTELLSKIKELQKEKNDAVSRDDLLKFCHDEDWLSKVLKPLIQTGDVLDYGGKYKINGCD